MKIVWLVADLPGEWNTSAHRVMTPSKRLAQAGHHCYVTHVAEIVTGKISDDTKKYIAEADVIVIERLPIAKLHGFIELQRKVGKQVWITFDDNYALIPDTTSRTTWRGGKDVRTVYSDSGAILNEFRKGLRLATGYMTPSKLLCQDYEMYNERGELVPNYLDPEAWSNLPPRNPDVITIGYGGTALHNVSLKDSDIIYALGKICKERPKVQVHLQPPFPDVVRMFNRAGVRYSLGQWERFDLWPKTVSQFHIGIAPLSGNYDMRRSNLKVLEYATLGIPWIATAGEPYADAHGGILVSNQASIWYKALVELITNKSLYEKLSAEGRTWAQAHNESCAKRYGEVFSGKL